MSIIELVAQSIAVRKEVLVAYLNTAPYRYKVYDIPKRSGRGKREIAQPARMLKQLQRHVVKEHLEPFLPIHEAATAYRVGIGIKHNAAAHAKNDFILKMDFSNFFSSIKSDDLANHLNNYLDTYDSEYRYLAEKLFFRKRKGGRIYFLSMGAPSSPFISNTVLYAFDQRLAEICEASNVTYTRYADDLAFSNKEAGVLYEFPNRITEILEEMQYPNLTINRQKTVFSSKRKNRHITGLVLNNDGVISIGRNRKRTIRAMMHNHCYNGSDFESTARLKGLLAYARDVDPNFYNTLVKKYSSIAPDNLFM